MFRGQGELFLPDVSAAQAAQADYLITGNKRDFPQTPYGLTTSCEGGRTARPDYI
jgi:hypothetical protein